MNIIKSVLHAKGTIFLFSILISFVIYWKLFFTFYSQDEWQTVGHMLSNGIFAELEGLNLIRIFFAEGRLFTQVLNYVMFIIVPFNVTILSIYAIIIHGINGALVYILVNKIIKNRLASLTAMLIFLCNSVSDQAVIWFAASVSVLTATLFVLLSLIYFYNFITTNKKNSILLSFLFLFISFYFKELALIFLPMYLLIDFLYKGRKNFITFLKIAIMPLLYFILFIGIRVGEVIFSTQKAGDFVNASSPIKEILSLNGILYPFIALAQVIIPSNFTFDIAKSILIIEYPFLPLNSQFTLIYQGLGSDLAMIFITTIILICILLIPRKKDENRLIVLSLSIIVASIWPYIVLTRGDSYLESRYYYLSVVGISLLIGILSKYIFTKKNVLFTSLLFIAIGIYLLSHFFSIQKDLSMQLNLAQERLVLLNDIKKSGLTLGKNTVLYISSDKDYLVPNNPLPFQEGLGYTMLVWLYSPKTNLEPLVMQNYLWDLGTQGYKKIGNGGYGFYSNYKDLEEAYKKNNFPVNDIYAYSWDSTSMKLSNNSSKIRSNFTKNK